VRGEQAREWEAGGRAGKSEKGGGCGGGCELSRGCRGEVEEAGLKGWGGKDCELPLLFFK